MTTLAVDPQPKAAKKEKKAKKDKVALQKHKPMSARTWLRTLAWRHVLRALPIPLDGFCCF